MRLKDRSKNKQMLINIGAQVLAFAVNICIGFFLTPYIIRTVGSVAYGFVGLANNFVSYVQILTTALNSMAGRFIAISYYKDKMDDVKKYYTSVFFSNVFISLVLLVPVIFIIIFIDKIINVPLEILNDVQILWTFIFGTMIVSIVGSIFNNAAYVKNRLELVSLRTVESNCLKALILIISFACFTPKVWYVGMASLVCVLYVMIINIYYTKMLMPMVEIKKKYFDFMKIKELVAAGIWNSVAQLGNILSTGLDLLITNLFVGAGPMGIVSLSKVIPTYIQSLFITVSSVFAPQLTISYAEEDQEGMKQQLSMAMKLMGLFASIPIAFIAIYGEAFYQLWTPSQNSELLTLLTCAAVLEYPISLLIYPLENVFATFNKVKVSSVVTIITSICSFFSVMVLVQIVDSEYIKMLIVVGVSCLYNVIKNGVFVPIFCSRLLNVKAAFFYKILFKSLISTGVLCGISYICKRFVVAQSWGTLIIAAIIVSCIGLVINFCFLLEKKEKSVLFKKFYR